MNSDSIFSIEDALRPDIDLKSALRQIWTENEGKLGTEYTPLAPNQVAKDAVVFLSMNPSLAPHSPKGSDLELYDTISSWNNRRGLGDKVHPHFKKFITISEANHLKNWFCLDMFFLRHTHQDDLEPILSDPFMLSQARLTLQIIKAIQPKLVIVANRTLDRFMHEMGSEIGFNPVMDSGRNVYHLDGIPFIIRESGYMGSNKLWNANLELRARLYAEIKRVLSVGK